MFLVEYTERLHCPPLNVQIVHNPPIQLHGHAMVLSCIFEVEYLKMALPEPSTILHP